MDIRLKVSYNLEDRSKKNLELNGTFIDNRIIYTDDVKTIIDLENKIITREVNDNYKIELNFNESRCKVYIKEACDYLELNMNVIKYEHKDNKLTFAYYFENNTENILGGTIEYKNV